MVVFSDSEVIVLIILLKWGLSRWRLGPLFEKVGRGRLYTTATAGSGGTTTTRTAGAGNTGNGAAGAPGTTGKARQHPPRLALALRAGGAFTGLADRPHQLKLYLTLGAKILVNWHSCLSSANSSPSAVECQPEFFRPTPAKQLGLWPDLQCVQ